MGGAACGGPAKDDARTRAGAQQPLAVNVYVPRPQEAFPADIAGQGPGGPQRRQLGKVLGGPSVEPVTALAGIGGE